MRSTIYNLVFLFLVGVSCARSNEIADMKEDIKIDDAAVQKAEEVAETVRQKSQRSEKAERRQDLVKDSVSVKKDAQGKPVIEQTGEASSYGRGFHGKTTANGEKFNKNDMTAAHPTLPLGTEAKVTNLENGRSVDVRINDRGPYIKGRDIDLSQGAAKKLDITKPGLAPVKIEAKLPPSETPASDESPAASTKIPRAGK